MKYLAITFALFTLSFVDIVAQVTYESNDPLFGTPLGFVGWNDNLNTNLDLRQKNIIRMRLNTEDWPGYNNRPAIDDVNRIFLPLNTGLTQANVFSILQLGVDLDVNLQREWMNTGITIGADGNDLLWTGIIPDPDNDDSQQGGDAAIAWGDNQAGQFGPDNLRFLFISQLTAANNGPNSDQGRETMRITPRGNVGMGDSFSNALQPSRRLVVHRQTNDPQFRISHGLDADPLFGQNADFQVTENGVLHLKASDDSTRRPIVVGFLENEDDNPTAFTYLDVGGITRVRDLREDSTKTCLILGTFADTIANGDSADHYLTRLDFPQDSTFFLAGDATWRPVAGSDNDWESDGTDV